MKINPLLKNITHRLVWVGLLASAGVSFAADADQAVTKSTALPPKVPGKERTAKIQLTEVTAIAAKKGWLQEEYAKVNAKVEMVNSSVLGVPGAEASLLDRGDLHITSRMAYPALQHRANGLDAVVIWQSVNAHPRRVAIQVLADSNIQTVADLKDKKLGSSLVGCPYYGSREAIIKAGHDLDTDLAKGDIRFVNISGAASISAFLAGKIDSTGSHPGTSSTAPLYVQKQVREIATAVPGGAYTNAGGRTMFFAMRKWSIENPDLVKAFLLAWDRTVRWINSDNGAHWDEAAQIASRELREPKAVALYDLKDVSRISWSWGQVDYADAVDSVKKFQEWAISVRDPFFTKKHLTDKQIEAFIDKRFFAGGDYFVDTSERAKTAANQGAATPAIDTRAGAQLAQATSGQ